MSEQQKKQKWRVEKRDRWLAGEFWAAFQGKPGWFDNTPRFDTWAEAMAYADEQARTGYDEDYGFDYQLSTEGHQPLDLSKVTRITVVGDAGKGLLFEDYHAYGHPHGPELSLQDEGKTLKILPTRRLLREHNAKARGRKTIRIDDLLGVTDEH